jgi:hypothetical protein
LVCLKSTPFVLNTQEGDYPKSIILVIVPEFHDFRARDAIRPSLFGGQPGALFQRRAKLAAQMRSGPHQGDYKNVLRIILTQNL